MPTNTTDDLINALEATPPKKQASDKAVTIKTTQNELAIRVRIMMIVENAIRDRLHGTARNKPIPYDVAVNKIWLGANVSKKFSTSTNSFLKRIYREVSAILPAGKKLPKIWSPSGEYKATMTSRELVKNLIGDIKP